MYTYTITHTYIHFLTFSYFNSGFIALFMSICIVCISLCPCFMLFSALFSVLFVRVLSCPLALNVYLPHAHLVGVGARLHSCFACGYTPRNSACHCTIPQFGRRCRVCKYKLTEAEKRNANGKHEARSRQDHVRFHSCWLNKRRVPIMLKLILT